MKKTMRNCPCGRKAIYSTCCGPFIAGDAFPETAEQLMRSRYTAYTQANVDYIADTMKGPAAKDYDKQVSVQWASSVKWIRLKVIKMEQGSEESVAYVEFLAVYRVDGSLRKMQERSEFHRIDGRWYYWDGTLK